MITLYCIYLRKSRADLEAERRGEGETLSRHRAILTGLAAHNHHPVGHIYQEIVSGETLSDRPQARQLLEDLAAGRWQGVYVMEIERLSRGDAMDQAHISHAFKAANARIITPVKTYDPQDQSDETFFEFSLFMSRQEFKTHYRRMQGGRAQSRQEGKWIQSMAPYGYRRVKIPHDKGYTLEICEPEAAVVRQVFDWYLNGIDGAPAGISIISKRLTQLHIPVGLHGLVWDNSRVWRMLSNPAYAGKIQWGKNKTQRVITPTGIVKTRSIADECELTDGLHEPIIPFDVFQAVTAKRKNHGHIPVRKGAPLANPFARLIYCKHCGYALTHLPASGRQPAVLKCMTPGCPTVQTYRVPVENAVLSVLSSWLHDPGVSILPPDDPAQTSRHFTADSITAMSQEQAKIRRQIDRLHDLVEQEVYTVEQYNTRYVTLHLRLQELSASIAAAEKELAAQPVYCTKAELAPAIIRLLERYDTSTPAEKNDLLSQCVSKILYSKSTPGLVIRGNTYASPNSFNLTIYPLIK